MYHAGEYKAEDARCAQICHSPEWYSASKLMSRRIELGGRKVGGTMMERKLTVGEIILIAGSRVALGAGIGLLLSSRVQSHQRKPAGVGPALVGGRHTYPLRA